MDQVLAEIHAALGITQQHLVGYRLSFQPQPSLEKLQIVEIDFEGKPFILLSPTATAWLKMKSAAATDGISLRPFSGFRSYLHQKNLIERHLKIGRQIETILTHIAIPGFSEHHSGRAIDIHSDGKPVLDEEFEQTKEFAWLEKNAARFDFHLSYPRGNTMGIIYEPWHWFYKGT